MGVPFNREEFVKHLREQGLHEQADRAERELPEAVEDHEHESALLEWEAEHPELTSWITGIATRLPGGI
jgi:hypothetical protein